MSFFHLSRSSRNLPRRGVAAVEFALVLPVFLILLIGVWEIGRLIEVKQLASNAAREGSRRASTGQYTNAQVQQIVLQYLQNAGVTTPNAVVTVSNLTNPPADVNNANQMDRLRVEVSIPFGDVRWVALNFFLSAGSPLAASADCFSLKDIPLSVSTTIPVE